MSLIEALLLGLVQGLTEFLPVSSSGHLAILKNLLQIKETGIIFSVLLHTGTLAVLLAAFRQDVKKLLLVARPSTILRGILKFILKTDTNRKLSAIKN